MLAYFVQNSELFEVASDGLSTVCPACSGAGLVEKALSAGESLEYLCPRCAGARRDVAVRYR